MARQYFRDEWYKPLMHTNLPSSAKMVASVLAMHTWGTKNSCHPGIIRIMRMTSLSRATVVKYTKKLVSSGWLIVEKSPARRRFPCNLYIMKIPKYVESPSLIGDSGGSKHNSMMVRRLNSKYSMDNTNKQSRALGEIVGPVISTHMRDRFLAGRGE